MGLVLLLFDGTINQSNYIFTIHLYRTLVYRDICSAKYNSFRPTSCCKECLKLLHQQRIIETDIPDIASVYGGVRGRSMSSKGLGMVWPTIKEAGVKTVIELRCFDDSKKLPIICEKYGIDYFRFPIDRKVRNIEEIIAAFPRFCELIDKGDFYMACYHGLHRTDIAVSLYWVFYGADRGVEPPQIRGYREDEGRDTSKIMRVLNAMYAKMTEINGAEPMPAEVYKERKRIINELSRM